MCISLCKLIQTYTHTGTLKSKRVGERFTLFTKITEAQASEANLKLSLFTLLNKTYCTLACVRVRFHQSIKMRKRGKEEEKRRNEKMRGGERKKKKKRSQTAAKPLWQFVSRATDSTDKIHSLSLSLKRTDIFEVRKWLNCCCMLFSWLKCSSLFSFFLLSRCFSPPLLFLCEMTRVTASDWLFSTVNCILTHSVPVKCKTVLYTCINCTRGRRRRRRWRERRKKSIECKNLREKAKSE